MRALDPGIAHHPRQNTCRRWHFTSTPCPRSLSMALRYVFPTLCNGLASSDKARRPTKLLRPHPSTLREAAVTASVSRLLWLDPVRKARTRLALKGESVTSVEAALQLAVEGALQLTESQISAGGISMAKFVRGLDQRFFQPAGAKLTLSASLVLEWELADEPELCSLLAFSFPQTLPRVGACSSTTKKGDVAEVCSLMHMEWLFQAPGDVVGGSWDGGVDVELPGVAVAQCKALESGRVSSRPVQQFFADTRKWGRRKTRWSSYAELPRLFYAFSFQQAALDTAEMTGISLFSYERKSVLLRADKNGPNSRAAFDNDCDYDEFIFHREGLAVLPVNGHARNLIAARPELLPIRYRE